MTTSAQEELAEFYKGNFFEFLKYLNPLYSYGQVHQQICNILQEEENNPEPDDILCLIPRAHLKSHICAGKAVWDITREPWTTILYSSANDDLVKAQMFAIQNMLESDRYRKLWPDMINKQKAKRSKWTDSIIRVDHPLRQKMGIRDFTLAIQTVKSSATGLHCDRLMFDDIVTEGNAYTTAGRNEVRKGAASYIGIKNPGARTLAVGTRYDPKDVYGMWIDGVEEIVDDLGNIKGEKKTWKVISAVLEDARDGTGKYLWPRNKNPITGKWYGFDPKVRAKKKAEYLTLGHLEQFYAQFYNEPNDPGMDRVDSNFVYTNQDLLVKVGNRWLYDNKVLNIFAGMDLAFSDDTNKKADYSAIAIIGVDCDGFIYILDLTQYRTLNSEKHYQELVNFYDKWKFKKVLIETNNGGALVAAEIKKNLRQRGRTMPIETRNKTRHDGNKLERYALYLDPRYEAGYMYHRRCAYIGDYELQVRQSRPAFDDLKDSVCCALEIISLPASNSVSGGGYSTNNICPNPKYGGRRRAF